MVPPDEPIEEPARHQNDNVAPAASVEAGTESNKIAPLEAAIINAWSMIILFLILIAFALLAHRPVFSLQTALPLMFVAISGVQLRRSYQLRRLANIVKPVAISGAVRRKRRTYWLNWRDASVSTECHCEVLLIAGTKNNELLARLAGTTGAEVWMFFDPKSQLPFLAKIESQYFMVGLPSHSQLGARRAIPATMTLTVINLLVYFACCDGHFEQLIQPQIETLIRSGALLGAVDEPWRFVTCGFLHAAWFHILFNMIALIYFGGICERLIGGWKLIALYIVTSVSGALLSATIYPRITVGASGAIMGMGGFLFVYRILRKDDFPSPIARGILKSISLSVVAALLLALPIPFVDSYMHIGGMLSGAVLACVMAKPPLHFPRLRIYATLFAVFSLVCLWFGARYRYFAGNYHRTRGIIALARQEWSKASDELTVALEKEPTDVSLHQARCGADEKIGKLDRAIDDFRFVISHNPSDLEQYNNFAWLLAKAGQYKEAVEMASKMIDARPAANVFDTRAVAYIGLKQYDLAVSDLQRAIKMDPFAAAAHFHLGQAVLLQGHRADALVQFDLARRYNYAPEPWELKFGRLP